MTNDGHDRYETAVQGYLRARVSRAQLLTAVGLGAAAAALPGGAAAQATTGAGTAPGFGPGQGFSAPYFPQVQGTYTTENLQDILNIAQTMEYLATTMVNAAVVNAGTLGITGLVLQVLQAALAEEVYHVQFLASMGATPLTTTFTVPDPKILTDYNTFFGNLETLETICNAAYMTATREFAEAGQPTLAKFAYQAGAVEAEHRVMARAALVLHGVATAAPPNNKAFETDYFLYLRDAANVVKSLGFIGGSGQAVAFPGTTTALANARSMASAVIQKVPNNATTSVTAAGPLTGERT
ncbi:MAG: ferritin-like domain-containing protein [Chloroflexi bacterium]|nr:ferritin-like domain-containing protein [Chloroflexota bacterium]